VPEGVSRNSLDRESLAICNVKGSVGKGKTPEWGERAEKALVGEKKKKEVEKSSLLMREIPEGESAKMKRRWKKRIKKIRVDHASKRVGVYA